MTKKIIMLGFAKRLKNRILHARTREVCGNPIHPQTEKIMARVNPIGPGSCYDEGKRGAAPLSLG